MVMSEGRGQYRGKVRREFVSVIVVLSLSRFLNRFCVVVYFRWLHVRVFACSCFCVVVRTTDLFHTLAVWKNFTKITGFLQNLSLGLLASSVLVKKKSFHEDV